MGTFFLTGSLNAESMEDWIKFDIQDIALSIAIIITDTLQIYIIMKINSRQEMKNSNLGVLA
jgi:hypothetical protein